MLKYVQKKMGDVKFGHSWKFVHDMCCRLQTILNNFVIFVGRIMKSFGGGKGEASTQASVCSRSAFTYISFSPDSSCQCSTTPPKRNVPALNSFCFHHCLFNMNLRFSIQCMMLDFSELLVRLVWLDCLG